MRLSHLALVSGEAPEDTGLLALEAIPLLTPQKLLGIGCRSHSHDIFSSLDTGLGSRVNMLGEAFVGCFVAAREAGNIDGWHF